MSELKNRPVTKPRKKQHCDAACDSNTLYASQRVLVTGLGDETTPDALSNYMELMTGEDVRVTFLGQGRAVVVTGEPPDFEKLERNIQNRKLDSRQLSMERINVCDSILVSGLSPKVTKDAILNYFENKWRSGGENVADVKLFKDTQSAIVVFEQFQVIDNVIGKEHTLEGKQLHVEKYYPQISSHLQTCTTYPPLPDIMPCANERTAPSERGTQELREIYAATSDREMTCIDVDADIMQFIIMIGVYTVELVEETLEKPLKAEIKWTTGDEKVTILKKVGSGYIKKWKERCRDAVTKFLDQFEKFSIPLGSAAVTSAINQALPRLQESLSRPKALCKSGAEGKQHHLVVVCHERDRHAVEIVVENFLGIVEKEEVRKTYEKDKIEGISKRRMEFLRHIKFVEEMKSQLSTELDVDFKNQEMCIMGPRDQVETFKVEYFRLMNKITEQSFKLPSKVVSIFARRVDYFQQKLNLNDTTAMFFPEETENVIRIVAKSFPDFQQAKECLLGSIKEEKVPLDAENAVIFKSKECGIRLLKEVRKSQLVDIHMDKSGTMTLSGAKEAVEGAKREIVDLIEMERIRRKSFEIPKGLSRFLKEYCVKELKEGAKKCHVTMGVAQNYVEIKGAKEDLEKGSKFFRQLCSTINKRKIKFSKPGLGELIRGENGKRNLKMIEVEKGVVIEMCEKGNNDTEDKIQECVLPSTSDKKRVLSEAVAAPNSDAHPEYDILNFTTKEGLNVSWVYGNLERIKADVLVSSATSNLNSPTMCGKALNAVGGRSFVQACEPYNDIGEGNIACTAGGNLPCKNVLHAVCRDWHTPGAEKILRSLVNKILSTCTDIRACSMALPIIGVGQHKFPEKVVLRVYKEEIEKFSARTSSLQSSLKDILVVVFSAKRPATRALPSQPMTSNQFSPGRVTVAGGSRVVSFGHVRVTLLHGDITQQTTRPDALINILPRDLRLQNGGGVCSSILESGGRRIQDELNAVGGVPPGSVVKTSAGSIVGVKKIIHVIPATNDVPGLRDSMEKCLNEAKAESLSSVSIPAVGTASFNVSAKDSAELILKAAKNFSNVNYPLTINIVVFQRNMMADFERKIQEKANTTILVNAAQPSAWLGGFDVVAATPDPRIANASKTPKPSKSVDYKSLKSEKAMEVIQLIFIASSQRCIEGSIREVQKFINDQITIKTIEHRKVGDVLSKNWPEIEKLAREYKVNITCESRVKVSLEGLVSKISDCKEKLLGFIQKKVEEEQRMNEQKDEQNLIEYFSKIVQWSQVQGRQPIDYGKELNATIERAFINEDVHIAMNAQTYDVDFTAMILKNQRNGHIIKIARKQLGESSTSNSDIQLPTHWSRQPEGKMVSLVSLPTSSAEHQNLLRRFTSTGGGSASQVISIERIQNPKLYKAYAAMRQNMTRPNEMQLFHGTRVNNTAAINQNGFNRIFAGANGVALGNGIYFAKNASTSLTYSSRGGTASGHFKMYLASVLVGDYTLGVNGIKTAPKKNDPNNPELLYDSTTENLQNPTVFVTFLDPQCYPEYLITFK